MDGRTLLGALVRAAGFGLALIQLLTLVGQLVQLAGIGFLVMKQPQAADAATAAVQQAVTPILIALLLLAVGILLLRQGDKVANWAYSERSRRGAPPVVKSDTTAAKPAPKRAAANPPSDS
jgi:hypothetical protein